MCKKNSHKKTNFITTGFLLIILIACSSCNVQISIDGDNVTMNGVKLTHKRTIHLEQVYEHQSATIKLGSGDMKLTGQKDNTISLDIVIFEKEQNDASVSFDNGRLTTSSKGKYPVYISSITGLFPENISLRLSAGSGDMSLQNFVNSSEISVNTGSGDITMKNCSNIQYVEAQAGSGDISMNNSILLNVDIQTGSGDISISKSHIEKGETQTGSGDIILSNSTYNNLKFDTGSGDVINKSSGSI
jgi:hypothetical protein